MSFGKPGGLRVFLAAVLVLLFLWLLFHIVPIGIWFLSEME